MSTKPLTNKEVGWLTRPGFVNRITAATVPRLVETILSDRAKIARKNARINALVTRLAEAEEVVEAAKLVAPLILNPGDDGPYERGEYPELDKLNDALAAYNQDSKDAGNG